MNDTRSTALRVLVIDDERHIRTTLRACIEGEGHHVTTVGTAGEALAAAANQVHHVAFLDLRLGIDDGLELIPRLLDELPSLKIVVITAHATVESAVEAMKLGATDYLPKPFEPGQVRIVLRKASELRELESTVRSLTDTLQRSSPSVHLESSNSEMRAVISTARKVAATDATVLLRGDNGTGKGVVAKSIHTWSARSDSPFVVVHAPSLSAELLESELFGHEKGAFTGATRTNPGRIAQADGGTLFLDEIGDLPMGLQSKLLRFVQDQEYERVGNPSTRRADVRIVAATNRNLEGLIADQKFREDLYYRLRVIELEIPPLRSRPEDILPLAEEFSAFFGRKYRGTALRLTEDAERALHQHDWPGNVRELQNAMERASMLCSGDEITESDLPSGINSSNAPALAAGSLVTLDQLQEAHVRRIVASAETLEDAARILGIDTSTLWRRRKQYGV